MSVVEIKERVVVETNSVDVVAFFTPPVQPQESLREIPETNAPSMARAFHALVEDDSQNEPPDFDVPGDDFGS